MYRSPHLIALTTAVFAAAALTLSATPSLAAPDRDPDIHLLSCALGGWTVSPTRHVTGQSLEDGAITVPPLAKAQLPYTPKVGAFVTSQSGVQNHHFLAVDTTGALWQTSNSFGPGVKWMSRKIAASGFAGVTAMVASQWIDETTHTRMVYAATSSGTLVKYALNTRDFTTWTMTRVGQFPSKGWNTVRSLGRYYLDYPTEKTTLDGVLAVTTTGQLIRYTIPLQGESIGRTVLRPRGWNSIAHVQGTRCVGKARRDGVMLAYTTSGQARVYVEDDITNATGDDIRDRRIVRDGFVGVHF